MSKKTPNKRQQAGKGSTSPEKHLASAQPAREEVNKGGSTGEVPAAQSNVAKGTKPSHEQIAVLAYQLWEANGKRVGTDQDDWFQAEKLLRYEG